MEPDRVRYVQRTGEREFDPALPSNDDGYDIPPYNTSTPYSKKKQVLAAFCCTLGCLLNGAVIGYTGPALPSIMNITGEGGTTVWGLSIELEAQAASWITGLLSVGCFVGCIIAGPSMEYFGRRVTLMVFTSCLYLFGFLLILFAKNAAMVLAGRFFNGMGLGFVLATTSIYLVEIATTDMRGFLGCFVQFQGSLGVLALFAAGCFLNWWELAILKICLVVPFVVGMYICPETPVWLFTKGRTEDGRKALEWLRGSERQAVIEEEIKAIEEAINTKINSKISASALLQKSVLKPFLISLFMMFFLNFAGLNVMIFYCNSIFFYSGANISSNLASVIVGFTLLFSCVVAIIFITKVDRRIILISSMTIMCVCYILLGGCFYFLENLAAGSEKGAEEVEEVVGIGFPSWLPPLSIILLLFAGNGGYGTLIWVVTAELLPPEVRSIGNSIIICFSFIFGFIVSKTFVDLVMTINASGTFWLYAATCLVGTIYTAIVVPETRGKTVEEIAQYFR